MIKFGDIEYFELLSVQDYLKGRVLDRLGLVNVDRLRIEVDMKIAAIHLVDKERRDKLREDTKKYRITNWLFFGGEDKIVAENLTKVEANQMLKDLEKSNGDSDYSGYSIEVQN